MKLLTSHRVYALVFVSSALAGAVAIAACTGDDAAAVETPDGGGLDGAASDAAPETPDVTEDGGEGEEITDGGGLPPEEDEDGGTTDLDGGFDGGTACDSLTAGAFVESKCAFLAVKPTGGALSSGTYVLAGVTAFGSKAFCTDPKSYVAYDHRGALEVTATSATAATFEFLDQYRKSGAVIGRPTTNRYDVGVSASGSTLTYTAQSCAVKAAPPSAAYATGVLADSKKKTITLRLPYGTGSANFYFVEQ